MSRKTIIGAGLLTLATLFMGAPQAQAADCYYRLYQDGHGVVSGPLGIQGYAAGLKLSNACDRARRECNRRFERARKKGQLPRGGPRDFRCIKTSSS